MLRKFYGWMVTALVNLAGNKAKIKLRRTMGI